MRAATALACASSKGIGSRAALMMCLHRLAVLYVDYVKKTYALSMLLNLALQTSILGLTRRAISRISVPICSPSRSQSVQTKRTEAPRACVSMFRAITFLSYLKSDFALSIMLWTYISNEGLYRRLKKLRRLARLPFAVPIGEIGAFNMSCHASKGDRTLAPPLEVVVKLVVLYPLDAADIFLEIL